MYSKSGFWNPGRVTGAVWDPFDLKVVFFPNLNHLELPTCRQHQAAYWPHIISSFGAVEDVS